MAIRLRSACAARQPNASETRRRFRPLAATITVGLAGLVLVGSSGCRMTSEVYERQAQCVDEFMVSYRNRAMAEKAWHCQKNQFGRPRFQNEFKEGFIAGYLEVAEGGNGCTPCVAPSEYWGWRYQSANGQAAVNAWFEAFPYGVRAAEQDGVGNWGKIRLSGSCGRPAVPHAPIDAPHDVQPADPFYPDEGMMPGEMMPGEMMPGEMMPSEMPLQLNESEMIAPPMPDSAASNTPHDFSLEDLGWGDENVQIEIISEKDELVSRFQAGQPSGAGELAGTATEPIASEESTAAGVAGSNSDADDTPAAPASGKLPFSFE